MENQGLGKLLSISVWKGHLTEGRRALVWSMRTWSLEIISFLVTFTRFTSSTAKAGKEIMERSPASISLDVDALGSMENRIDWMKNKEVALIWEVLIVTHSIRDHDLSPKRTFWWVCQLWAELCATNMAPAGEPHPSSQWFLFLAGGRERGWESVVLPGDHAENCLSPFVPSVDFAGPLGQTEVELRTTCVSRLGCSGCDDRQRRTHIWSQHGEMCCFYQMWQVGLGDPETLKGVKIQKTTQSGEMVSNRIHLVLERMGSLVAL